MTKILELADAYAEKSSYPDWLSDPVEINESRAALVAEIERVEDRGYQALVALKSIKERLEICYQHSYVSEVFDSYYVDLIDAAIAATEGSKK